MVRINFSGKMIFRKKKDIRSIQSYTIRPICIFKKADSLYLLNGIQEEKFIPKVSDYYLNKNKLFYQQENLRDIFVLDIVTKEQHKVEGSFSIGSKILFSENGFYVIGESSGSKKLFLIDHSFAIKQCIDYTFPLMLLSTNDGILFKKKGQILIFDIHQNKEVWFFELPSDEKVQAVEQVNGVLVVQSSVNKLYGLDEHTGKQLWELSNVSYHHTYHAETGMLYSFGGETFRVINPRTGEIVVDKKFEGAEEKYRISPQGHMHSLSEDHLYFMSNWHEPRFGAVNLKTHEIAFVQELEAEEGVKGGIPHYYNGKLCIKDSLDALHIFERD